MKASTHIAILAALIGTLALTACAGPEARHDSPLGSPR
jgi:hypothetical protein